MISIVLHISNSIPPVSESFLPQRSQLAIFTIIQIIKSRTSKVTETEIDKYIVHDK